MLKQIVKIILVFFISIIINFSFGSKKVLSEILEYELTAIKLTYDDSKNLIIATGDAIAKDNNGKIIKTFTKSFFKDNKKNTIIADNFIYNLDSKKISAINNVKYEDKDGNFYLFDKFEYFELDEIGYGKNLKATNVDGSKIKATEAKINNRTSNTTFEKGGVYTTCDYSFADTNYLFNKINTLKECPDWEIVSKKTRHNKKEKMVYHDHPILKLKGVPVFYVPYFSHPDPSVKRKSGFLTPSSINNENYGRNFKIPYYYVLNESEDFTFAPIIYLDENPNF